MGLIKRWQSGAWGVASFAVLAVVVVGGLALAGAPAWLLWAGGLFVGGLLALSVVGAVRGSARRPQKFSAFDSNALGEPETEEFQPAYQSDLPLDSSETVLCGCAPVMQVTSGLGDLFKTGSRGFLGRARSSDAENALVLTQRRLLFCMIGPDELKRFAANPRVTKLLEALPGQADAKRRMLFNAGAAEVREALDGLLAAHGLAHLQEQLFSFSVPLDQISAVSHSAPKRTLYLRMGERRLSYFFKYPEDLEELLGHLAGLGLRQG